MLTAERPPAVARTRRIVEGWRMWGAGPRITDRASGEWHPILCNPFQSADEDVWTDATPRIARCSLFTHVAPAVDCDCGYYICPTRADVVRYFRRHFDPWVTWLAIGRVRGSGRILDGSWHDPVGTVRARRLELIGPLFLSPVSSNLLVAFQREFGLDVRPSMPANKNDRRAFERWADTMADTDEPAPDLPTWFEVAPRLFQGDSTVRPTPRHFDAVATMWESGVECDDEVEHLWAPIDDGEAPDEDVLDSAVSWVRSRWERGQRVLVRCQQGRNRSGLVVAQTLMDSQGASADEAIAAVRAACGNAALSNAEFVRFLRGEPTPERDRWGQRAAGILFCDGDRFLLLRRATGSREPFTWGLPGGASFDLEPPWRTAVREAVEELGQRFPGTLRPLTEHEHRDDDGWAYSTFIVDYRPRSIQLNDEHDESRWVTDTEARQLPLHPDLRANWQAIMQMTPRT